MAEEWVTMRAACRKFGISNQKLYRLISEGFVPQREDKKVLLSKVEEALKLEEESKQKGFENNKKAVDINLRLKMAMAKNKELKNKLLEIEKQKLEGKLVPAKEIEKKWSEIALTLKTQILSWSSKLPPLLEKKSKKQISKILKEQINELLEMLSENAEEKE